MKAIDLRAALGATRSIARHGRASDELKAARKRARQLLDQIAGANKGWCERPSASAIHAAHSAIVRACQGMGLPGLPARGPRPD